MSDMPVTIRKVHHVVTVTFIAMLACICLTGVLVLIVFNRSAAEAESIRQDTDLIKSQASRIEKKIDQMRLKINADEQRDSGAS
jgi:sensor domain CHASE-containing protein